MNETHLVFPQLETVYHALAPFSEALLRVVVGLWMVPHGLRMAFGFFPGTGIRQGNVRMLAVDLDTWGYRPGWLWAPLIAATELVAGPMLASVCSRAPPRCRWCCSSSSRISSAGGSADIFGTSSASNIR